MNPFVSYRRKIPPCSFLKTFKEFWRILSLQQTEILQGSANGVVTLTEFPNISLFSVRGYVYLYIYMYHFMCVAYYRCKYIIPPEEIILSVVFSFLFYL